MIYKQPPSSSIKKVGTFIRRRYFPGLSLPNHGDHGYGPLAAVDDATLEPGTLVRMHEHRNDEIVSYVHQGAMRHFDSTETRVNINPHNLMVMNAGRSFWHEELVREGDGTTRTLQIFIRPHTIDLEPQLQQLVLTKPTPNRWRYLVGPAGAPATIRNDVRIFDGHLVAGSTLPLPAYQEWDSYFVVLRGEIEINDQSFSAVENGLLVDEVGAHLQVKEDALMVVFLINRHAPLSYAGTVAR